MKKLAVLALIAVFLVPTLASAQAPVLPGSGWWTGEQVQNVGTADATIVVTAYDAASSSTYVASASAIATGASANFNPASFAGMPAGFQGSAVVSSDQPLAAVVNVTNRQAGSYGVLGGLAGGQYQGVNGATAGTPIRFPIAKNSFGSSPNIKTTTFFVQNAGTAAAPIHISYVCTSGGGAGNTYNYDSAAIQPGQMVILGPAQAGVPANTLCSATASAGGQPLAGVATEHYASETVASLIQVTRALVPMDYANTIYAPIFKNRYPATGTDYTKARTVGVQVQNVSGGVADIKATYYAAGGACAVGTTYTTTSAGVADGAAVTFINPAGMPYNCLASAKFEGFSGGSPTANANIVGIANESYLSPAAAPQTQASTAYFALPASTLTNKLGFPLYKEKYGNKTTGVQVQNTSAVTATIHVEFKVGTTTYTTVNQDIAAGSSANFTMVSNFAPAKWVGGTGLPASSLASMTVFSNQPVVGVANETPWYSTTGVTCFGQAVVTCYDKQNYEGFNLP